MTQNYTAITPGAAANAATINAPLDQLDDAIGAAVSSLTTTSKTLVGGIDEINYKKGTRNIGAGVNTLASLTSGTDNTAIGDTSLYSNTTGIQNVALGAQAGHSAVDVNGNIFIGYQAGYFETGDNQLFIGSYAGHDIASGRGSAILYGNMAPDTTTQILRINAKLRLPNQLEFMPIAAPATAPTTTVAAGGAVDNGLYEYLVTFVDSLGGETDFGPVSSPQAQTTTGNNTVNLTNIPVGGDGVVARKIYRGLYTTPYYRLVTTINNNTATTYSDAAANSSLPALGTQAKWNTTAGRILINGLMSGYVGTSTTGLGSGCLASMSTGFDNTAFGWQTLAADTTGYNNTAIGVNVLLANNTGSNNSALGVHAMQAHESGNYNSALGVNALRYLISGNYNVGLGGNALFSLATGDNNVGVGYGALNTADGMVHGIAIGSNALYNATNGPANVAIGSAAMQNATTGQHNVGIGYEALKAVATGIFNTAVGSLALHENAGNANIALGYSAGYFETGSDKLFIDNRDRGSEANGRTMSLIYGVMNNAVANQSIAFNVGAMGFYGHAAAARPAKASHNNWAAVSDVVAALVEIGLLDAA